MEKILLVSGVSREELERSARHAYLVNLIVAVGEQLDAETVAKKFTIRVIVEYRGVVVTDEHKGIATVYGEIDPKSLAKRPELAAAGVSSKFMIVGYHLDRRQSEGENCFLQPPPA